MDGDLWGCSYDQGFSVSDGHESSTNLESGWQADFYFGSDKDVIEENAMNEKYCVQVLKILIPKADAEIEDLEENLVLLQCELAWTESRNQFEACCTALREKINIFDRSIKNWGQSDETNKSDHSPLQRQPAKKLYEILKPFLGDDSEQDEDHEQDNREQGDHHEQDDREQDDAQDQHATVNNQSSDTTMQFVHPFSGTSNISGIKVKSEEIGFESILLAVDAIPNGSVLKHKKNNCIPDIEVKPKIAIGGVRSNSFVTEENSCTKSDNLKSVSKVKIEEAKEHIINNSCKSRRFKSASNVVGERGLLKAQKQGKSVSEKANPEVPRQSDGLSGSKRSFDPNSSSLARSKSGNCNKEEKLIEFLLRKKRNKSDLEPFLPQSTGSASCLSSNTKGMDSDLHVLDDTSNLFVMWLKKLQDLQGNVIVRTQTKETNKLVIERPQNVNVSSEKPQLNVDHRLKAFTERRGEIKLHTSISKAKKRRKPGAIGDDVCLVRPLEWKQIQDGALDVEKNLGSLSQNKGASKMLAGKEFIDLSLVDDTSSSDQIKPDSRTREDKDMVKSHATIDEKIAKSWALLPSSALELKKLTIVDLKIIAKELHLTNYHKLRKPALLDLVFGRLKNGLG